LLASGGAITALVSGPIGAGLSGGSAALQATLGNINNQFYSDYGAGQLDQNIISSMKTKALCIDKRMNAAVNVTSGSAAIAAATNAATDAGIAMAAAKAANTNAANAAAVTAVVSPSPAVATNVVALATPTISMANANPDPCPINVPYTVGALIADLQSYDASCSLEEAAMLKLAPAPSPTM
jgi:hypothetical protein